MAKRLLCRLGFHRWVTAVSEGERYLTCKRCKAYGGSPSFGPFQYPRSRRR